MVDILLKRYLWLVQTLRERGKLTYEELASAWERSGMNDEHSSLSQRTLYNHIMAVMKHFGVEIVCRRGRGLNQYYIANPEVFHENNMKRWLFDNFSLSNTLSEYSDISDKILLEDIPAGQQYLNVILSAIRRKRLIQFKYCNFSGKKLEGRMMPLCVKLFKRRWYVLGRLVDKGKMRVLSLDRVTDLSETGEVFTYPADFNAEEFFSDYFGITSMTDSNPQIIRLRAYAELPGYLNALPIHHSQKVVESTADHTDYELFVALTFDFIQEILLHREQLEVLSPQNFRDEIHGIIKKMKALYE